MTSEPIVLSGGQIVGLAALLPGHGADEVEITQSHGPVDTHHVFVKVFYESGDETTWALDRNGERRIISRNIAASVGE